MCEKLKIELTRFDLHNRERKVVVKAQEIKITGIHLRVQKWAKGGTDSLGIYSLNYVGENIYYQYSLISEEGDFMGNFFRDPVNLNGRTSLFPYFYDIKKDKCFQIMSIEPKKEV